jgi:MFS superfamily sulfate permease-like transporter
MAANDYHRGEMDISEQKATYAFFGDLTKWGSLWTAVGLLVLTLWFAAGAGFLPSMIAGAVALFVGWLLLKKKPDHHGSH